MYSDHTVGSSQAKADRVRKMNCESARRRRAAEAQKLIDAVKVDEYGTTIDHKVIQEAAERNEKEKERKRNGWKKRVQDPVRAQEVALNFIIRKIARDHRTKPKSEIELKTLKNKAVDKIFKEGVSTKEHLEGVAETTFANYTPRADRLAASRSGTKSVTM